MSLLALLRLAAPMTGTAAPPEGPELTCACSTLQRMPWPGCHPPPPPPPCPLCHPLLSTFTPCRIEDLPDDVLERVFVLAGQQF